MEGPAINLVIIGYRGTGKTTVARLVAQRLNWQAVDVDDQVEEAAGCSVAEIFATRGEPTFRDIEEHVVARWIDLPEIALSTGGGTLMRPANRQRIGRHSHVVWLTAPAEVIHARMAADPVTAARRPALTKLAGLDEIHHLLALRTPWYEECATLRLDSAAATTDELAAEIIARLSLQAAPVQP